MKKKPTINTDFLGQWIKDAGSETPPLGFSQRIMTQIQLLPQRNYQPVISPLGWKLILGYITTILLTVLYFIPSENSGQNLWSKVPLYKLPKFPLDKINLAIPTISINGPMLIATMAFLILGIVSWWYTYKNNYFQT